ncbi:MAG: GCN5-related N-acetyltransferase [Marmoricola sp.]|jgi:GNAT superfamily N-acetyltransferase|nr:GCN5-related N-acetyltransferase [Marmoricola sp.]
MDRIRGARRPGRWPSPVAAGDAFGWDVPVEASVSEIIDGWVDGWACSRGVPRAEPVPDGWFLQSSSPEENGRIVLTRPSPERLREVVEADQPERRLVKFAGDPDVWLPRFPRTWVPEPPGWFMTRTLRPTTPGQLPSGYSLEVESTSTLVRVRISDARNEVAAGGQLGAGSSYAVPDRIVTEAGHQRLGLGTVVMAELGNRALELGLGRAVLGATAEGRALYEGLGWQVVAPMSGAYHRPSG